MGRLLRVFTSKRSPYRLWPHRRERSSTIQPPFALGKARLGAFLSSINVRKATGDLVVRHGSALAVIREQVDSFNPEVLVVGAQRRAGLTRALIGEIPEDVLARPPCDIIAVHA
jgi:nucleotide-binding universal stress UspA family protein